MNDRQQANLDRINGLWGLHERRDGRPQGRCLGFVVDNRYLERDGLEWRVGVSFGHNVVTPETVQGFARIPAYEGEFAFGLHLIANRGNELTIYDEWMDAYAGGDCADAKQGETIAQSILESMSDDEYLANVRNTRDEKGSLKVSSFHSLEDFEVVKGEAF